MGDFTMEQMFIQTEEQRAILESVERFVNEVVKPRAPALDALTDPAAGYSEEIVAEGGGVVKRRKPFLPNGNRAIFYLIFIQTEKNKPMAEGISCFLLERGRNGF